jgi:lipopolysaccharide biosynthesis glycosyltransferase
MTTAFVTLCDKAYVHGLEVLDFSLRKNSPDFYKTVDRKILLTTDMDSFRDYEIDRVDPDNYHVWTKFVKKVMACKLRVLELRNLDKVVFYEADTLCLQEISDLLSPKYDEFPIYSVKDYFLGIRDKRKVCGTWDAIIGDGWVLNMKKLRKIHAADKMREVIIAEGPMKMADQDAITILVNRYSIPHGELPVEYDFLRTIPDDSVELYEKFSGKIKVVHYVGRYKPFTFEGELTDMPSPTNPFDRMWYEYYFEYQREKNSGGGSAH